MQVHNQHTDTNTTHNSAPTPPLKVTFIGGGCFGTAMANMAARKGSDTLLWNRDSETTEEINTQHRNSKYLAGFTLEDSLRATTDLSEAITGRDIIFMAVPSQSFRQVLQDIRPYVTGQIFVSLTKGVEPHSYMRMSQLIEQELPQVAFGVLSGPNLAKELVAGTPAGTVIASSSEAVRDAVYMALSTPLFRVFSNSDVNGVEWAGALKNIYAVAMGMANAYKLGENGKSLILTRALAEMTRFATHMQANPLTFLGLAGVGDLIATCSSAQSRNYQIGYMLGEGKSLQAAIEQLGQTAEGVNTIEQVKQIADINHIDMPITQMIYQIIFEHANPIEAAMDMISGRGQRSDVEYVLPNTGFNPPQS